MTDDPLLEATLALRTYAQLTRAPDAIERWDLARTWLVERALADYFAEARRLPDTRFR